MTMTAARAISPPTLPHAELAPILEDDIADLASFIAAQSGRSVEAVEAHLHWFLLENPALQPQHPLGFGLRSSGQFVGCILCSPQAFRLENKNILMMGSSSFYVDTRHRGHGGRIFLQYSRLGSRWPLFGTSANAEAAALWKAAGASPIPHSEAELFGILHWPPVVEEFAHRRNVHPMFHHLAGSPISRLAGMLRRLKIDRRDSEALQLLTSAEQVNDLVCHFHSAKLTALREPSYIRWRYFSGSDATAAVFAFRSRKPDREILVAVNQRTRGYRGQINTLNVLDVYPEIPLEEWLRMIGALIARYGKAVEAVVLRSQDLQRQKMFCELGFQHRAFDAPNGWFLDKASLLPACDWYPVPADGDGLI
ncbi:MAG TPA: hypothetical protein VFF64_12645 [Candidatus Eremiobacteraceae bacterium]|nr:hypothetical protein [Candidatus Eremiobacteraceae bacterium]